MELSYNNNNNNRFSSSSSSKKLLPTATTSMANIDHAVWDQVTSKFIQTIKRLEDKIEIDRKNLLSYKKEQHRHNLKLSNNVLLTGATDKNGFTF